MSEQRAEWSVKQEPVGIPIPLPTGWHGPVSNDEMTDLVTIADLLDRYSREDRMRMLPYIAARCLR